MARDSPERSIELLVPLTSQAAAVRAGSFVLTSGKDMTHAEGLVCAGLAWVMRPRVRSWRTVSVGYCLPGFYGLVVPKDSLAPPQAMV